MYYLKSRYYDPNICRFINADSYASTGQGFVGYNMFSYCSNNPTNLVDRFGKDAVWIQETGSASGFGHSGLISQDERGDWFYFFWGPANESFTAEIITGTESAPVFIKLNTEGCDMTTTEGVVSAINQSFNDAFLKTKGASSLYVDNDYVYLFDQRLNYYVFSSGEFVDFGRYSDYGAYLQKKAMFSSPDEKCKSGDAIYYLKGAFSISKREKLCIQCFYA